MSGIRVSATGGPFAEVWQRAMRELADCCGTGVLWEGGVYRGTWLESTGSISAEVLGRFMPDVARETLLLFARHAREDGLLPYKVTQDGPAYRQVQMVTPLARSVWNHYLLAGDRPFLREMFDAMVRNDAWLARYRDTRGTGCVEAFCAFDTGHDLSPRFWHVPDTTPDGDPARYDLDTPSLPFLAPDLTANVACQRRYLALTAADLGQEAASWERLAGESLRALFEHCHDDGMFYDRDAGGSLVRVESDVLLRVLACEVGDSAFFDDSLRRYLLNPRKFFARYPFTSVAMDDPRFDHDFTHNSWGGPSNFLSLLRAPHAFEHHGRHVELSRVMLPVLEAVCRMDRFPQTYSPWTGEAGFTEGYSPAMLWTIDAVERLCGILPRPDGELWFTGLAPSGYVRGEFEFVSARDGCGVYRDGREYARFPHGWRLITDSDGEPRAVVGMGARPVTGTLTVQGASVDLTVAGNERVDLDSGGQVAQRRSIGLIHPVS